MTSRRIKRLSPLRLSKRPTINYLIRRPLTRSPFANSANLFANGHLVVTFNGQNQGIWRWLLRIVVGFVGLIIILLAATTINASLQDKRIEHAALPDGSKLIDVNGRTIHVHIQSEEHDGPVVVFVGCFGCNTAVTKWTIHHSAFIILHYENDFAHYPACELGNGRRPPTLPRQIARNRKFHPLFHPGASFRASQRILSQPEWIGSTCH